MAVRRKKMKMRMKRKQITTKLGRKLIKKSKKTRKPVKRAEEVWISLFKSDSSNRTGNGKQKFYSTADIIAFCQKWRLPANHIWSFSSRKSVASFFAAYDALCEEGTTTTICKALDEVADISIPECRIK